MKLTGLDNGGIGDRSVMHDSRISGLWKADSPPTALTVVLQMWVLLKMLLLTPLSILSPLGDPLIFRLKLPFLQDVPQICNSVYSRDHKLWWPVWQTDMFYLPFSIF